MYHARPSMTKALIMSGTGHSPGKEFVARRIKNYRERGIEYRWDYTFEDLSPAFRQTPLATYFADMFAERNSHADLDTIIRQFEALREPEAADHFSSIKCPTTILSGSEDGTHQAAFALKELIPECEMQILHGTGHACQIEQPWLFDRYMIDFLKSHNLFVK